MYLNPFLVPCGLTRDVLCGGSLQEEAHRGWAANGTINRELATLSHLFSMAVEWKWLDRHPCRLQMLEEGQAE
jgi:hypothetical protein